jgi:hypothetical protein
VPVQPADRSPRWLRLWGWFTAPCADYLLLAKFWQTFPLTRAKPFVGFGSFEGDGMLVLLLLPFLALHVCWIVTVVVRTVIAVRRRAAIPRGPWLIVSLSVILALLAWTRQPTWDRLFVRQVAATHEGPQAFMRAAAEGDVAAVRAFHEQGIPLEGCFFGWSALHVAAREGRLPVLRYLLDQGVRVNTVSGGSNTALDEAEQQHHEDVVAFLRARGGKEFDELAPEDQKPPCAE